MKDLLDEIEPFRAQLSGRTKASNGRGSRGLPSHVRAHARGGAGRSSPAHGQRVVVKSSSVRLSGDGASKARAHLNYLQRDGTSQDGDEAAVTFSERGCDADAEAFLERTVGDRHQFRFIVSPEAAHELDLEAYARDVMSHVSEDLGTGLDWVGVAHYNTDNPHVHIVLRGVDDQGDTLFIDPAYLTHGFRRTAEAVATYELGPRTEEQQRASLERSVTANHYTPLDRELMQRADSDEARGPLKRLQLPTTSRRGPAAETRGLLYRRLQHLSSQGLARDVSARDEASGTAWEIPADLPAVLRQQQIQADIVRRMHAARQPDHHAWDLSGQVSEPLLGRVHARGLHDEHAGTEYLIVTTGDGKARHFTADHLTGDQRARVGSFVELRPEAGRVNVAALPALGPSVPHPHWVDRPLALSRQLREPHFAALARERTSYLKDVGVLSHASAEVPRDLLKRTRELERRTFAAEKAQQLNLKVGALAPGQPFRGRHLGTHTLHGGTYCVIASRTQVLVLPSSQHTRSHAGAHVEVTQRAAASGRVRTYVARVPDSTKER